MASNSITVKAKGYSTANAYTFKIDANETGNVSGNSREITATLSCYAVNPGGYQSFSSPRAYVIVDGSTKDTQTIKNIWPRKSWVTLASWTGYLTAGQSHTITGRYNSNTNSYNYLPASGNNDVSVTLSLAAVSVSNRIDHWSWGYENGEGNNGGANGAYLLANTYFSKNVGESYSIGSGNGTTIPNGFYLQQSYGTASVNGSWGSYSFGTVMTQGSSQMSFEYDYFPNTYTITYNLNGGINNSSNPSSYNVLYGKTFLNPSRTGYQFNGWYDGNTKVTGINEGKNATFSSASDLYNQLSSRTIGDKTISANWIPNQYVIVFNANGGEGLMNNQTLSYDLSSSLTANVFTRNGYLFLGWGTNASDTTPTYSNGQSVINLTSENGGVINLYAIWKEENVILRTKKDDVWVKGKGYYKKGNSWVKIKKVYVKKNGQWVKGK